MENRITTGNKGKLVSAYEKKVPAIHENAYVDVAARIIGDVIIEDGATIWPMAVLRADSGPIRIGCSSGVLDLALVEAPTGYPVRIGENSLVSHGAMIHGATIETNVLVGMGAMVLDGAVVASGSIVAAGSVVTAGTITPPNSLLRGCPAMVVRETTEKERQDIRKDIDALARKGQAYLKQLSLE